MVKKGYKETEGHKKKKSLALKGKTYEQLHGKEKAKKLKENLRKMKLGKKNPKGSETKKRLFKEGKLKPWNYIDGQSKNRKYLLEDWKKLIKRIYARDNYTCQECGKKGGLLNAHHIIPWAISKNDCDDNLITLCVSCHAKIHIKLRDKKGRWKN